MPYSIRLDIIHSTTIYRQIAAVPSGAGSVLSQQARVAVTARVARRKLSAHELYAAITLLAGLQETVTASGGGEEARRFVAEILKNINKEKYKNKFCSHKKSKNHVDPLLHFDVQ